MTPRIVGIVNITEDSFSDGGRYLSSEAAIEHARRLVADGADIVELGAASSHPDAMKVSPDEEIARLAPVIEALKDDCATLSIDSSQPETQRYALRQGVDFLNDVRGFPNQSLYSELAEHPCKLVVMHSLAPTSTRDATEPETALASIHQFFAQRVKELGDAGVVRSRLLLDPGMGFFLGGNPEPSFRVLGELQSLRTRYGIPFLVSVSRKSFLRAAVGRSVEEIGPATLAAELFLAWQGVEYLRTHEVRSLRDALTVLDTIREARHETATS
jgi:dihydropteroate synthase type 2